MSAPTTKVTIVVYESAYNIVKVAHKEITYYDGQDYTVELNTPDGPDWAFTRKAGEQVQP